MRITLQKSPKHPRGFSLAENLGFLVCLLGLLAWNYPKIKGLSQETHQAKQQQAVALLESAKNQFSQEASIADRKKFNEIGNEGRFTLLGTLLPQNDPTEFARLYELKKLHVNDLDTAPTVE